MAKVLLEKKDVVYTNTRSEGIRKHVIVSLNLKEAVSDSGTVFKRSYNDSDNVVGIVGERWENGKVETPEIKEEYLAQNIQLDLINKVRNIEGNIEKASSKQLTPLLQAVNKFNSNFK